MWYTLLYSTLLCLAILQPTLHSALPGDIPTTNPPLYPADIATDHPLCSLQRYSNRPSVVIFSVSRYYTNNFPICSIPLCMPSLQPTIGSAPRQRRHRFGARQSDYQLSSVWRHYNRLYAVLLCSLSIIVHALKLHTVYYTLDKFQLGRSTGASNPIRSNPGASPNFYGTQRPKYLRELLYIPGY
jgi:hypothetical protein